MRAFRSIRTSFLSALRGFLAAGLLLAGASNAASNGVEMGPLDSWRKSSGNVEAAFSLGGEGLEVPIPFDDAKRDNFALAKRFESDLRGMKFLALRVQVPLKSSLTVEATVDGKLVRLASYRAGTGGWETWWLPVTGSVLSGLNLSFGESGNATGTGTETRTTRIGGIWTADAPAKAPDAPSLVEDPMDYKENLRRVLSHLREDARRGLSESLSPRGHELADRFFRRLREDALFLPAERVSNSILRTLSNQARLVDVLNHQVTLLGGIPKQDVGFPIRWLTFPKGDFQWGQHLSYQYWMKPLAYAYAGTGDETYASALVSNVLDWIRTFPMEGDRLRWMGAAKSFGPGIPATREGAFIGEPVGIGPWVSLNSEWVVHAWPEMMALIARSPSLDNEAAACILRSLLEDQLWQLLNHERSHTANQYVAVGEALVHLGMWFPDFAPAARAEEEGWRRIDSFCRNQIYPDGSMAECSPNYATGSLGKLFELFEQAKARNRKAPDSLGERIPAAMRYWALVSDPWGRVPRIAKGSGDILKRLATWNEVVGEKEVAWRLSGGSEGRSPTAKSALFPWAGHAAMRTGFDSNAVWLFFEPGPRGAGHHDKATLNLQLVSGGETLLADPGFYTYSTSGEEGEMAHYLHGTSAHNLALVDGEGQGSSTKGVVSRPGDYGWTIDGEIVKVRGTYSNGFGEKTKIPVVHAREIAFDQRTGETTVVDRFSGEGSRRIELRWQTDPAAEVSLEAGRALVRMTNASLEMAFSSRSPLEWTLAKGERKPHAGWFSSGYGNLQPATTLRGVVEVELPFEVTTRLSPKRNGPAR